MVRCSALFLFLLVGTIECARKIALVANSSIQIPRKKARSLTLSNKYSKVSYASLVQCDRSGNNPPRRDTLKYYGYTLKRIQNSLNQYVFEDKDGVQALVNLPTMKRAKAKAGGRNCFAFATRQDYMTPGDHPALVATHGNSPVHAPRDINEKNFQAAMEMEGAIFLGRDDQQMKKMSLAGKVVEGRVYYLVVALITPGDEFHFWGLWNTGWYSVSSLISSIIQPIGDIAHHCPSGKVFTTLRSKNIHYNLDKGGFFLFPCRGKGSKGLSGSNECWS